MKPWIYLLSLMMIATTAPAQDSWKVTLNGNTILSSSEHNETLNTKKIPSSEWKKNGYLEVIYKEATPSNWLHTLQFTDETGIPLLTKDSALSAKIPMATLRKLFARKKQLKIYLLISPSNPKMMAPSRMLHLGTFRLP